MYSRTQPMDTAPLTEVTSPGAETRLEGSAFEFHFSYVARTLQRCHRLCVGAAIFLKKPILQLSVGVGGGNGSGSELYPERPNAPDCGYYRRNGFCGYGARCRFNHPRNRSLVMEALRATIGEHPERFGQAVCQEPFLFPAAIPSPTTYPALQSPSIHSTEQYGMVFGNWPVLRPTLLSSSYLPGTYGPTLIPPEMVPMPDWTSYLALASQSTQSAGVGPVYGPMQLSASTLVGLCMSLTASPSASINIQKEFAFLNRPGQPECRYCVKFGECKYGSSCKYHHPPQCYGSSLRPGAPICSHYSQVGVCKFGPSCKFDHPLGISYSPSASFLADMPVAPYPGGSFVGTLDPSSSSSDLRPELVSGSSKEVFCTQASSMSAASDPVGSMFSKGDPVSHSGV
ncbi:hypothetical protein FXO37_19292 [Capsicum annuum]|nr:hypothetical protein FXO37_19292 [Capsicum annuum]